ncbi:MAG TPA: hypothetical protein PLY36_05240, partial [Spirochaetota bacterium]|nr:hypothetical protein [Spirochaetota bacterium]
YEKCNLAVSCPVIALNANHYVYNVFMSYTNKFFTGVKFFSLFYFQIVAGSEESFIIFSIHSW